MLFIHIVLIISGHVLNYNSYKLLLYMDFPGEICSDSVLQLPPAVWCQTSGSLLIAEDRMGLH